MIVARLWLHGSECGSFRVVRGVCLRKKATLEVFLNSPLRFVYVFQGWCPGW